MKMRYVGGKNPLQICRYCFDSRSKVPTPGGSMNTRQKKINLKQKEEMVGKGGGIWLAKGEKDEVILIDSALVIHCVLCHLRL